MAAPALFAVVGVFAAHLTGTPPIYPAVIAAILAASLVLRPSYWILVLIVGFGFASYTAFRVHHHRSLPLLDELQPGEGIAIEAEGVVASDPQTGSGRGSRSFCFVNLKTVARTDGAPLTARQRVYARLPSSPEIRYGDLMRFSGIMRHPNGALNPGEFDFANFLALKGVYAEVDVADPEELEILQHDRGNPLVAAALRSREWIANAITQGLREDDPDVAGVITAMVLGTRGDAPDEIIEDFKLSGTLHLFAVSGLHVGMIGVILWEIFKLLKFPRRVAAVLVILSLISYAFVTGLRPSAVRASIMASVVLLGIIADRPSRLVNSLGAAALIILVFDPLQALMPGFQLSFVVLLAIAGLAGPLQNMLRPMISPDPFLPAALIPKSKQRTYDALQKAAAYLSVSTAAWLGSLPLMLFYFNLATPIAVVTNLLLIPLAFIVIFGAVASMLLSLVTLTGLSVLINNANFVIIKLIAAIIAVAASVPGGHFFVASAPGFLAAPCEIRVLRVPKGGAAIHLRTRDGGRWLIDCGGYREFERILLPFSRSLGINNLDGLILTHADGRHIGAANEVISLWNPENVYSEIRDRRSSAIREMATAPTDAPAGSVLPMGKNGDLHVLFPTAAYEEALADDNAMVVQLRYGDWRVLFTSDAGFQTENWLLENLDETDLESDVLVMGRHARDHSGLIGFIKTVDPQVIVATNAVFPPEETIPLDWRDAIDELGIILFDLGECGCTQLDLGKDSLSLKAFVGEQAHTLRKRAR